MDDKRYNVIDFAKFIFSIFVIAIHTQPLANINAEADFVLSNIICRIAIPFFLVCSGFFMGKKSEYSEEQIIPNKKYIKGQFIKIFKMYLVWSMVYLFISIYNWKKIGWFSPVAFIDWGIGFFTKGSYYHLWYLISLLYAIPLVSFIMKTIKKKYYSILMIVLYIVQVIVYAYSFVLPESLSLILKICDYLSCPFIALTRILPFLLLGIIISREKNDKNSGIMFLVNLVFLVAEIYLLRSNDQEAFSYVFFTFPTSYYLFKMVLMIGEIKHIGAYKIFRSSTFVYCVHPIFVWVMSEFFEIENQWIFILTVILSIVTWEIRDVGGSLLLWRK